jgi:hypothetical protein
MGVSVLNAGCIGERNQHSGLRLQELDHENCCSQPCKKATKIMLFRKEAAVVADSLRKENEAT